MARLVLGRTCEFSKKTVCAIIGPQKYLKIVQWAEDHSFPKSERKGVRTVSGEGKILKRDQLAGQGGAAASAPGG